MHDEVEDPVREHRCGDEQRRAARRAEAAYRSVRDVPSERPQQRGDEAVGVGHVVEVEGIGRGDPGCDPDLLEPRDDEDAPEHVEQLDGEEQRPQGDGPVAALRGEAHAIVADEHYGLAGAGTGAATTLVVKTPGA